MLKQIFTLIMLFSLISHSFLFANDIEDILQQVKAIKEGKINRGINNYEGLPLKSGTRLCMELIRNYDKLDESMLTDIMDRPDRQTYIDTDRFRIHYDSIGYQAPPPEDNNPNNGIPDYVDSLALVFEYVCSFEVDTLGFIQPVSDDTAGGSSLYDVYLSDIGGMGYYGITYPETIQPDGRTWSSYIEIENDFANPIFGPMGYNENPMAAVKVTAAHEFFHAIHFSIDAYEAEGGRFWWYEVSSVWMEDVVFDEVNDYLYYLKYFFHYPWLSLESFTTNFSDIPRFMHPYASCVWARFLHERFDREVIRQIWEICGEIPDYNTLQATDQVINNYGSSFEEAFIEFASWNYFTCHRADTVNKYSEADQWINPFTSVPDTIRHIFFTDANPFSYADSTGNPFDIYYSSDDPTPEPLSANYLAFTTYGDNNIYYGDLVFEFDGDDISASGDEWRLAMLGWDPVQDSLIQVDINQINGQGTAIFYDWDRFNYIVVIPSIFGYTYDDSSTGYSFEAYYDPGLVNTVWPGDLDNNGVVGAADILPLVDFWYETGNPRDSLGYSWSGYDAYSWSITMATYADADGNGCVNIRDFPAICLNWGLTHGEVLSAVVDHSDFNIEAHRDILELLYGEVKDSKTGPQYEIRLFLEGLLDIPLPNNFALYQNYPNPFNLSTCISYELSKKDNVSISIYNIAGQLVKTYNCGIQKSGIHRLVWDGCNESGDEVISGLYFYKLKSSENVKVKKMVMLK